jgi:hypothetical protein
MLRPPMCCTPPCPLYPSTQSQAANCCHPAQSPQHSMPSVMTLMPSLYEAYAKDYSKLSKPMRQLIVGWKNVLAARYKDWGTRSPDTRKPMTKNQRVILKIHTFLTSNYPLGQDSICPQNGSSTSTQATSHASQPIMAHVTHLISSQSTCPCSHQMICQLD